MFEYRALCSAWHYARRALGVIAVALLSGTLATALCLVTLASSAGAEEWIEPVDAPVVDPFRPPATRFGAGNRGLEYGVPAGSPVVAVDNGVVVFVGLVGAQRYVVIDHGGGLRSSYAFVTSSHVVRGQRVDQGQLVATAGAGFHLTARLGGEYVDPALLFAGAEIMLRLTDGVPAPTAGQSSPAVGPSTGAGQSDAIAAFWQSAGELDPSSLFADMAHGVGVWSEQECTSADVPVGPVGAGRIAIQVGGLGSSSDDASIGDLDLNGLGYDSASIVGFSYAGGCTTTPFGQMTPRASAARDEWIGNALDATDYSPQDTYQDVYQSAARLADLVDAIAAQQPGTPIDIAAHSLGGVVTRLALELLADRHPSGVPVDVVLTIGSPHQGADLGTSSRSVNESDLLSGLAAGMSGGGQGQLEAESVRQIAEAGIDHLAPPPPPVDGVRVVAIAGSTDLIVPSEAAIWDGAVNSIVDTGVRDALSAHSDLPARPEVARELGLAIAGLGQRCVGLRSVLAAAGKGAVVDAAENAVGVLVGLAAWVF